MSSVTTMFGVFSVEGLTSFFSRFKQAPFGQLQNTQFPAVFGKVMRFLFTSYVVYLVFSLWYNWLLLPLFLLVPAVTYKYLGGLLFLNVFGYFPGFFIGLFDGPNSGEENVKLWYSICCEHWQHGDYFDVLKFLIEVHGNILSAPNPHNFKVMQGGHYGQQGHYSQQPQTSPVVSNVQQPADAKGEKAD